jgi:hypothetical protein
LSGAEWTNEESVRAMFPTNEAAVKARRVKICDTLATLDGLAQTFEGDPAKVLVMAYIGELVGDGHAEWTLLANGDVELRFLTGEIFLLADTVVTRII